MRNFTDAAIFTKPSAVNAAMKEFDDNRIVTDTSPSCFASD